MSFNHWESSINLDDQRLDCPHRVEICIYTNTYFSSVLPFMITRLSSYLSEIFTGNFGFKLQN